HEPTVPVPHFGGAPRRGVKAGGLDNGELGARRAAAGQLIALLGRSEILEQQEELAWLGADRGEVAARGTDRDLAGQLLVEADLGLVGAGRPRSPARFVDGGDLGDETRRCLSVAVVAESETDAT